MVAVGPGAAPSCLFLCLACHYCDSDHERVLVRNKVPHLVGKGVSLADRTSILSNSYAAQTQEGAEVMN